MTKYILLIEYDGTRYHGFQWQVGLSTIQNELEQAIKKFCGESSRVIAASRTDAGVHAKGQVVSFWAKSGLSPMTLVKALNYYLPQDIATKAAYKASPNFNVRRDALSREYRYYILNNDARSSFTQRFTLFVPQPLDTEAMNEACQLIQGEHDFVSFATSLDDARGTVRNIHEAKVDTLTPLARSRVGGRGLPFILLPSREGNKGSPKIPENFWGENKERVVVFRVVANSFLPHQVRNAIGLLMRLGLGKISLGDFRDIMEARSLGLAGPTAPALGLWLTKVNYPKPLDEASSEAKGLR